MVNTNRIYIKLVNASSQYFSLKDYPPHIRLQNDVKIFYSNSKLLLIIAMACNGVSVAGYLIVNTRRITRMCWRIPRITSF